MSCDVVMPISDIVKEVEKQLNLKEYVKTNDGVANNLTLKGEVLIDGAAKASLCSALADCVGDTLQSFTLQDDSLQLTTADGVVFNVDLSRFMTDADGQRLADQLRATFPAPVLPTTNGGITGDGTANNPIRLNLGNGLMVDQDGKLTLNLGEGLKVEGGRLVIDDDGICTQVTKAVNTYTALPTDEILTSSGGTITFPASIPVGKSYTVIQTGDSEVKLVGHPNIHSVGGTTTLKGKNHAVTVIRGTSSDWFVYGGVRP